MALNNFKLNNFKILKKLINIKKKMTSDISFSLGPIIKLC